MLIPHITSVRLQCAINVSTPSNVYVRNDHMGTTQTQSAKGGVQVLQNHVFPSSALLLKYSNHCTVWKHQNLPAIIYESYLI